jgi:hypothetical protein
MRFCTGTTLKAALVTGRGGACGAGNNKSNTLSEAKGRGTPFNS